MILLVLCCILYCADINYKILIKFPQNSIKENLRISKKGIIAFHSHAPVLWKLFINACCGFYFTLKINKLCKWTIQSLQHTFNGTQWCSMLVILATKINLKLPNMIYWPSFHYFTMLLFWNWKDMTQWHIKLYHSYHY